ncbi:MAG TPA: hypothetical protein VMU45_11800 [Candidatus Eisenbacteria bacterium]|nr:hypothetical protein [Candidatus Eisenbacteria bacterium]
MATTATVTQPLARSRAADGGAQAVVLTLLYSLPALWSLRSFSTVLDNDVWWHLAAGKWILQHSAVPRTDPFSAYGADKWWAAYSWGFELPAAWLFTHFGLIGLLFLHGLLVTTVIVAVHRLIVAIVPDFTLSVLLTLAAAVAMNGLFTPRPWLLTILFFVVELHLVLQVRESGNYRRLLWLPLIFCAWANVHAQFVYGLFLLFLAAAEAWWLIWKSSADPVKRKARAWWTLTALSCLAATLVNPYFAGIYKVAYQLGTQPRVLNLISELGPVLFRSFSDYLLLVIGLLAVATLAWRRDTQPFPWVLLLWATLCSFRSRRDIWMLAVVGAATIAAGLREHATVKFQHSKLQSCFITIGVVLVTVASCWIAGVSSVRLETESASKFPAAAVDFIKQKRLPGPLFNDYNWGGYLIWSLPELPVSMDGRAALHGTPRIERSVDTWDAKHDWNSDLELQNAQLIIGSLDAPLCAVLRGDARYELAYEDKIASVFVRRSPR